MRRSARLATVLLALLAAVLPAADPVRAATITIINNDGADEGFNDSAPVAPIGGNPGTTLGAQRLYVFNYAASIWGSILPSTVTIQVLAQFNPQACDATSGILGSAGARSVDSDFPGAEYPSTWYHQALANKLSGTDQDPGLEDVNATFNSDVDNSTCLGTSDWYYGLDGNEGSDIELLPVVLHELAHGLGFSTFVNSSTGLLLSGQPDIYSRFLYDTTVGLHWSGMNNTQRRNSAVNTGNLVWDGYATTYQSPYVLERRPELAVLSPGGIAGSYEALEAAFGPPLDGTGVTGNLVLAVDGTAPTGDACEAIQNGAQLAGNIAVIDRGTCTFVSKVLAAQAAGAVGVLMVNNVAGAPITMGGSDPSVAIPSVMISQADGSTIKSALSAGTVAATLRRSPTLLAGADPSDRVLMYAPNPLESGSSVSHFDTSALPDLLMEPAINDGLHDSVDLTRQLFEDIGWLARTTDVEPAAGTPPFHVASAPNPFVPATVISLEIPSAGAARVDVFDARGRLVKHLLDSWMPAGRHAVTWDGTNQRGRRVGAGVYFSRVSAGGVSKAQRLVKLND
jgi:hypothetical protein